MKTNRKRIAITLLCLILALSTILVSCKPSDDTSTPDDQTNSTDNTSNSDVTIPGWDSEAERWVTTLDPQKYSGRKFKILLLGSTYGTYSSREFGSSEEDVLQSETVNDAAIRKMEYIEEHYGVEIVPIYAKRTSSEDIVTLINNDIQSGSGSYDAVMPYVLNLAALAKAGNLLDLAQYSHEYSDNKIIQFSMPWWDQSSIEDLAVHGKIFFAMGDITLLNKVCANAIVFNKEIIEDLDLESPYDLVDSGEWTFDKMVEMGKKFAGEADGDDELTYNDNWGLSTSYHDIINYYIGSGQRLATLDNNMEPVMALDSQQAITTIQDILAALNDRSWCIHAQEMDVSDMWDMSLRIFGEGRALFRTSAFSAVEKLKSNYSVDYGIVPLPKASKEQTNYLSYVSTNGSVSGIAMLTTTPDPEFSAYMIEVNAVEGKNYLTPAYYDSVLRTQAVNDEDSQRMLDIIFDNTVYDVGRVFNFGNIYTLLSELVQDKSDAIVSKIAENESAINAAIQELIDAYNDIESY